MADRCRLCGEAKQLQQSHIIPGFVWNWLKKSSVGGIRGTPTPNVRVQDGPKVLLLCQDCEQLFCGWETEFSAKVFRPIHVGGATPLAHPYSGEWTLRFCVSVSWRVLQWAINHGLTNLSDGQRAAVPAAELVWREFLLGKRAHPGAYEQHMIPLDVIDDCADPDLSPFMNRYLTRTVDMDFPASPTSVLTWAKMGRLLLIGFVCPPGKTHAWRATRIGVREGTVGAREMWLPRNMYDYMNERANKVAGKLAELSPRQQEKVDQLHRDKADEIATSDAFRALQYDVRHSDEKAFRAPSRRSPKRR